MSELQQTPGPAAPAEDRPDWVVDTVLDGQSIRTVTPKLLSPLIKVGYPVLGIICLAVALFLALLEGRFTLFVGVYLALALAIFLLRWLLPRRLVERQLRVFRESYGGDSVPCRLVFWPQGLVLHNLTSGGHVDLRYEAVRRLVRYKGYLILITAAKQMTLLTPADLERYPDLPDYLKAKCSGAKRKGF